MATATVQSSPLEKIAQLSQARNLALKDSNFYPQIVPGVLPIIGPTASLELRRWGADFLAETFACPTLAADQKEQLSLMILETLKLFLEIPNEDSAVVKSVVQIATSIYPHVFKHTIYNPTDVVAWPQMVAIKSNILRRMNSASPGIRLCCIKFIQRVVQVQTPGLVSDPRRPENNDLSVALIPPEHPLLSPPNLQAEAFGLLDRLLNVFQESNSDALYITATINSIGPLVRTRPSLTTRILNAILALNPFKSAIGNVTLRTKITCRSTERTVRAFLVNLNKSNPSHPMAGRIQGYLDRLQQMKMEVFEEGSRKRSAPVEPTDGLDSSKRQRLGAEVPSPQNSSYPPLPPGPVSIAQLFTLTRDDAMRSFDVQSVPLQTVTRVVVPILANLDIQQLDKALNAVRTRFMDITQAPRPRPPLEVPGNVESSRDAPYTPEDAEQIKNRIDNDSSSKDKPLNVAFGPLIIPQPPPLSPEETTEYGKGQVIRVFSVLNGSQEISAARTTKAGFNRLAAGDLDRNTWLTILTRMATRPISGLESSVDSVKTEGASRSKTMLSDDIRESLYMYVLDDFRRRIDAAISWLNEEWYNERVQKRAGNDPVLSYDKWAIRLMDGILPYLDAKDKVLIRFLSELPAISDGIIQRVKRLAQDPERVSLAVNSLHYLALFRPPMRTACVDALEDLWENYEDAKASAAKMLQRWRPELFNASS